MKLALSQANPTNGDEGAAFAHIQNSLDAAARAGAQMLVVPELFLPGYNCPDLHAARAEDLQGALMTRLRRMVAAAGCGLTLGWAERDGDAVFNAATAITPDGRIAAHYRKIQLYGAMERNSFQPGTAPPPVFDLGGRRFGLLICYDIEFPGHAADLARRGAEIVLVPTANPVGFEHVQNVLVPARAFENRLVVAYANYCGTERGLAFGGQSRIVGPDAAALAGAGAQPALLITELPTLSDYPAGLLSTQDRDYCPLPASPGA
ncbi:MAG: nitrilase [Paracoccaceae bacterium]|nr:nitrilase [Paracoccaceae bacterium]